MTTTELDVVTGEIVPAGPAIPVPLTPSEARAKAEWVRAVTKAALTEGVDYGVIPGTSKPTLFKAGAEMLILAAGLGFDQQKVDDEDAREHRGVTYRCTVTRGDHVQAVCEAYAGYDERNFNKGSTPWNTLIKMAQKRALVGAALNAVAGSGLFIADMDDHDDAEPPLPRATKSTTAAKAAPRANLAPAQTTTGRDTGPMKRRIAVVCERLGFDEMDAIEDALGVRIAVDDLTFDQCKVVNNCLTQEDERQS